MTLINTDLGPQLEAYISELVQSGRYRSASEVLREGLHLIQERETRLAALDASIARGIADSEMGRSRPVDEAFSRLEENYVAMSGRSG